MVAVGPRRTLVGLSREKAGDRNLYTAVAISSVTGDDVCANMATYFLSRYFVLSRSWRVYGQKNEEVNNEACCQRLMGQFGHVPAPAMTIVGGGD